MVISIFCRTDFEVRQNIPFLPDFVKKKGRRPKFWRKNGPYRGLWLKKRGAKF